MIISVGIDKRDREYTKSMGLSPTRLLRSKICELRDGLNRQEMEEQNKRLITKIGKMAIFLKERGLIDVFQEEGN